MTSASSPVLRVASGPSAAYSIAAMIHESCPEPPAPPRDFQVPEKRLGRDACPASPRRLAGARRRTGDVGAVAAGADVVGVGVVGEVHRPHDLGVGRRGQVVEVVQIGMGGVDAGVEDRDLDALAPVAEGPDGRGADEGHARVEAGPDDPVQPDLFGVGVVLQRPRQVADGAVRELDRDQGQVVEGARDGAAHRVDHHRQRRRVRPVLSLDDDRQGLALVVTLVDQVVDVEERYVQLVRAAGANGLVRVSGLRGEAARDGAHRG